jgi:ribosomal protein S18 acetylase RimI-like enzyme
MIIQSFTKLCLITKQRGILGLTQRLRVRMRRQSYYVYRRDLSISEDPEERETGYQIQAGDLPQLKSWRCGQTDLPIPFYHDLLDGWTMFLWAAVGKDPVGILWMTQKFRFLRMASAEVAIVELWSHPQFRNRGIAKALVRCACRQSKDRGFLDMYATVSTDNVASCRVFDSTGFCKVGQFTSNLLARPHLTREWNVGHNHR